MRNIRNISKPLVLMALLLLACGMGVHNQDIEKGKRTTAEQRFDPLGFLGDDAVITGKSKAVSPSDSEKTRSGKVIDAASSDSLQTSYNPGAFKTGEVFRVQVFASKLFDEAQQFAGNIKSLFPEGVFVEYQMPYYKVRVGEYYTPEEGELFLDQVKQLGFKNAWLVRVVK